MRVWEGGLTALAGDGRQRVPRAHGVRPPRGRPPAPQRPPGRHHLPPKFPPSPLLPRPGPPEPRKPGNSLESPPPPGAEACMYAHRVCMHASSMYACIEYVCRGARCGMDSAAGEASRAWRPGTHQGRRPRFYSAVSGGAGRGPPRAVPRGAPGCAPRAACGCLWRASTRTSSCRAASAFCATSELRYCRPRPAS